jgi:DNA-binding protein YbaB
MTQTANDLVGRYAEMKDEIAQIRATAHSTDRNVTVVAGPGGSVIDVKLSEHSLRAGSPQSLGGSIMSAIRLAVADAARQQAAIVQRYVGDRVNIAERVNATQQEILGDKIEAGEAEQERLAAQQQYSQPAEGSVMQRAGYQPPAPPVPQAPRPPAPQAPPAAVPAAPHGGQQPAQPYGPRPTTPPPPRRPAPRPVEDDDDGFQGFQGFGNRTRP